MPSRTRAVLALAAALSPALAGCGDEEPARPAATTGSVAGTVLSDAGYVRGAGLLLVDPSTLASASPLVRTDAGGQYRVEGIAPGEYSVFVFNTDSLGSFSRTASTVQVLAGQTATHDILLVNSELWHSGPYWIVGSVTDAVSGQPIAGAFIADVFIASQDDALFAGVTSPYWSATDVAGRFVIQGIPFLPAPLPATGLDPLSVTKAGYEPATLVGRGQSVPPFGPPLPFPAPGESLHVQVRLEHETAGGPAGAVRGRVTFGGTPVSGIRVAVALAALADPDTFPPRKAGPGANSIFAFLPGKTAVTAADGTYGIDGLRPGTYFLHPAYLPGDGYTTLTLGFYASVTDSGTAISDADVIRALAPITPPPGASVPPGSVDLEWESFAPPEGFRSAGYVVYFGDGYRIDGRLRVDEPRATIGPFDVDARVRWFAQALAADLASGDTLKLGAFEEDASFQVPGPPEARAERGPAAR